MSSFGRTILPVGLAVAFGIWNGMSSLINPRIKKFKRTYGHADPINIGFYAFSPAFQEERQRREQEQAGTNNNPQFDTTKVKHEEIPETHTPR